MSMESVGSATSTQQAHDSSLRTAASRSARAPLVQFEAFVLQEFVSAMLPAEAASVYGKGLSGEMWQSMFAEKIAAQIAERGGIGIADRLLKDYHIDGEERSAVQGISDPRVTVAEGDATGPAKALLHDLQTENLGLSDSLKHAADEVRK